MLTMRQIFLRMALAGCLAIRVNSALAEPASGPIAANNTNRADVTIAFDAQATEAFSPNRMVVRRMVDAGIKGMTARPTTEDAWHSLVQTNDVVGFKVTASPGPVSGTRTSVVRALVESLLQAGFPPHHVIIWDKRMIDLQNGGWVNLANDLGVRCEASEESDWDPNRFYESPMAPRLIAGDLEFGIKNKEGVGRKSYVTRLLTQKITKIISVAPVLSHNFTGVNGHLTGLALGSVDNSLRFSGQPDRLAEVIPEICALDDLMPKVVMGVSDALICQYRGEETTLLHYAKVLNELRFSHDLVALDALALADIETARGEHRTGTEKPHLTDLYSNAELIEMGVSNRDRIDIHRLPENEGR